MTDKGSGRARWLGFAGLAAIAMPLLAVPALAQQPRLDVAASAEPDTLQILDSQYPPGAYVTMKNVTEGLWDYNLDGSPRPTVSDWTVSEDGKAITFKIHPGVKFSSGDELTSDDLKFSEERMMARMPSFRRHGQFIDHVETPDKYTAVVVFKQRDVSFIDGATYLLASKAYHDRVGDAEFVAHPVGIGPYKMTEYKPGEYIDLDAWDGYYGPQPKVKSARFYFIKDPATRVAKLRAGEVAFIMDTPFKDAGPLAAGGYNVVKLPANPTVSIEFAAENPKDPWHDVRVRQAIAHAIDGDAIVKGLFQGIPLRYPRLAPGEPGYDPTLANYSYDPALSRKLLAEAGFPNGFKMPLYYPTGNFYGFQETTEAVTLYLKAVGIEPDVVGADNVRMLAMKRNAQTDPLNNSFVGMSSAPLANSGVGSLDALVITFLSRSPSVFYKYPDVDAAITAAQGEPDAAKRDDDIKTAYRLIQDHVESVALWDNVSVYAMKGNIKYTPQQHRQPLLILPNVDPG